VNLDSRWFLCPASLYSPACLRRCERALERGASSGVKSDSATGLHVAATNQVNLALYCLHLWMWEASSRYLQRAQALARSLDEAAGADGGVQPPVFSGYHCVVFGSFTWAQRLQCLRTVARHISHQAHRPFIALAPRSPLLLLRVAYISSDFAAHTTGANILGLFRRLRILVQFCFDSTS
jgi:hypothetical protein